MIEIRPVLERCTSRRYGWDSQRRRPILREELLSVNVKQTSDTYQPTVHRISSSAKKSMTRRRDWQTAGNFEWKKSGGKWSWKPAIYDWSRPASSAQNRPPVIGAGRRSYARDRRRAMYDWSGTISHAQHQSLRIVLRNIYSIIVFDNYLTSATPRRVQCESIQIRRACPVLDLYECLCVTFVRSHRSYIGN